MVLRGMQTHRSSAHYQTQHAEFHDITFQPQTIIVYITKRFSPNNSTLNSLLRENKIVTSPSNNYSTKPAGEAHFSLQ